jgi:hypothetical protein
VTPLSVAHLAHERGYQKVQELRPKSAALEKMFLVVAAGCAGWVEHRGRSLHSPFRKKISAGAACAESVVHSAAAAAAAAAAGVADVAAGAAAHTSFDSQEYPCRAGIAVAADAGAALETLAVVPLFVVRAALGVVLVAADARL